MAKVPTTVGEIPKKKFRGDKVLVSAYITPELYLSMAKQANPDDGDRWESAVLRKMIRQANEKTETTQLPLRFLDAKSVEVLTEVEAIIHGLIQDRRKSERGLHRKTGQ